MSTLSPSGNRNGRNGFRLCRPEWARWATVLAALVAAVLAFMVQWGMVTTKLDHIDSRLCELVAEVRAMRTDLTAAERRVSFIEGRLNGERGGSP